MGYRSIRLLWERKFLWRKQKNIFSKPFWRLCVFLLNDVPGVLGFYQAEITSPNLIWVIPAQEKHTSMTKSRTVPVPAMARMGFLFGGSVRYAPAVSYALIGGQAQISVRSPSESLTRPTVGQNL